MTKRICDKCGYAYEAKCTAPNIIYLCPICLNYVGCECEYGFGPIVPCSILLGGKQIAEIAYNDSNGYHLISSELGIDKDLIKGYEQLGAYDEAVEIVAEQLKVQEDRIKDEHVEGVDYLNGALADFILKSDEYEKVEEWLKCLISEGYKYNDFAGRFLKRFGGLKFIGTGKEARSRVEVCFDPELYASGEYDRMEELEEIAGDELFPVGGVSDYTLYIGSKGKFYLGDWINFYECGDSTDSLIEKLFADDPFNHMNLLHHNDYMDRSRMVEQCKRSEVDFPVMKTIDYMDWTIIVYEVIWERNMICYDADGEVVWRVHGSNIGSLLIRSAKLTDDNKIIVHDILNDTFIVDPETGLTTRARL